MEQSKNNASLTDDASDQQNFQDKALSIKQRMLQKNSVFEKLLNTNVNSEPSLEEIIAVLEKKNDYRTREDVKKLAKYFQGLKFFESLKKESDVDDDIIFQCCRELKYRKYEANEKILNYGEEGNEFFIIIAGEVNIYIPKAIDLKLSHQELMYYIEENHDFILWERHNRYYQDLYHNYKRANMRHSVQHEGVKISNAIKKQIQNILEKEHRFNFDHSLLTFAMSLQKGLGFGELALMANNSKKGSSKRSATVISQSELHCALLDKEDFQKVFMHSMQKKLDAKVEFFKNFRLSEGISRANLNKLSYFLKEKQFRRRDIVYKEGDLADQIYFIKEGEFEISKRVKTQITKTTIQKIQNSNLLRTIEVKVSIIGQNQIIGLDDLLKDKITYRDHRVTCMTEKAMVYFLTREEYFSRFYKQLQKHVVNESQQLKEPFFSQRIKSLQNLAIKENTKYLKQKERFLTKETMSFEELEECKHVVDQVQNEELCNLLMKHKLLKRPQIKIERITSENVEEINDYDPSRYTNKDYFLKMSQLYNKFVFNTNQLTYQQVYSQNSPKITFSQDKNNNHLKQSSLKNSKENFDILNDEQDKERTLSKHRSSIFSKSPRQKTKVSVFMAGSSTLLYSQAATIQAVGVSSPSLEMKKYQSMPDLHTDKANQMKHQSLQLQLLKTSSVMTDQNLKVADLSKQDLQQKGSNDGVGLSLTTRNKPQDHVLEIPTAKQIIHSKNAQSNEDYFSVQNLNKKNTNQLYPNITTPFTGTERQLSAATSQEDLYQKPDLVNLMKNITIQSRTNNTIFSQSQKQITPNQKNKLKGGFIDSSRFSQTKRHLTLEDIQAHLQQSQNSLMQMLEARLRQRQVFSPQPYIQDQQESPTAIGNREGNTFDQQENTVNQQQQTLPSLTVHASTLTSPISNLYKSQIREKGNAFHGYNSNNSNSTKATCRQSSIYFNEFITRKQRLF